jgi:hypothetical protein
MTPDTIAAIQNYLASQPSIAAATENGSRIFAESLPDNESPDMPRTTIVVKSSGGNAPVHAEFLYQRVDIRCYGATSGEASDLLGQCILALQNLDYFVGESTMLYCATLVSGQNYGREPVAGTGWQYLYSIWSVMTDMNSPD